MQTVNDDQKQTKSHGLGRGLDSLIPTDMNMDGDVKNDRPATEVAVDLIDPNPQQPRREFEPEALAELAASIRDHGVLQPLLVTKLENGRYQLVAGERRLRASKVAGLKVVPVLERTLDEQAKLELAIIENLQRENLNPIELAISYKKLMEEFGLTQDEVADKVRRGRSTVANVIRLLSLPTEIKEALAVGRITEGHARTLMNLPADQQMELFRKIIEGGLNVRQAESHKVGRVHEEKDPNFLAAEKRMAESMGTKVAIKKSGKGGKVIIDYYSGEDLERIFRKIVGS